jgi:hypothetical protein
MPLNKQRKPVSLLHCAHFGQLAMRKSLISSLQLPLGHEANARPLAPFTAAGDSAAGGACLEKRWAKDGLPYKCHIHMYGIAENKPVPIRAGQA